MSEHSKIFELFRKTAPATILMLGASACASEAPMPPHQNMYPGTIKSGTVAEGTAIRESPVKSEDGAGSSNACGEVDSPLAYEKSSVTVADSVDANPKYVGFDPDDLEGDISDECKDAPMIYVVETSLSSKPKVAPSVGPAQESIS